MATTPQRWVRERVHQMPAGHWKQQQPGRVLTLAKRGALVDLEQHLDGAPDSVNRRGPHGRTLLWEACRAGKSAVVELLLSRGADPALTGCYNTESHVQLDALSAASFYKRPEIAARLEGYRLRSDLFRLCFRGDLVGVEALLDAAPGAIADDDPEDAIYYIPPIAFAVAGGHTDMLETLLARRAEVAPSSTLLIFLIALLDRTTALDPLMEAGLELDAFDSSTCLVARSLSGLEALIARGIPLDKPGSTGAPALVHLSEPRRGHVTPRVQLLLAHGADANATGPDGRTALHHAVVRRDADLLQRLLDHGGDPGQCDADGQSPRDLAATLGFGHPALSGA
ncbi:MAG: ankyrin repeat domain-containing protein [Pseudomonadota bacterium]